MAVTYTPKAIWHQQITMLDNADQVKGSIVGASNTPHQQLADSAAYLLARVVAIENGEVVPPTNNTDYGAWQITATVAMKVGETAAVNAVNDKYKSKPVIWSAALYNVNSAGVLSDKKVIKAPTAAVSDATGKLGAILGVIPVLTKSGSTVKQQVVFEINWGGEKNSAGLYAKSSTMKIEVADAAPPLPKPTDGFTYTVDATGAIGNPNNTATVTGILSSNVIDGSIGSILQVINFNLSNGVNSDAQMSEVKEATITNGRWSADFGLGLIGSKLASAGTQDNIFRIVYVFTIAGQRGFQGIGEHY